MAALIALLLVFTMGDAGGEGESTGNAGGKDAFIVIV
jgi:hypothetical protein